MKKHPVKALYGPVLFANLSFKSIQFLLLFLVLILTSSCLDDDLSLVSEIQQDFDGMTTVEVDAGFLDVEYIGESGRQVISLEVALRSNSSKKYEVDYRIVGSTLKVNLVSNKRLFSGSARGEGVIRLVGPRNMVLDLESNSGKITVQNVVSTRTMLEINSGELVVKNVAIPQISLSIASGRGSLEDILGNIKTDISSGKLNVSRQEGNIEAEISSGEVQANDINGQVSAIASSGKVQLENVKSIGNINITSGQLFATNSGLSPQTALKAGSGNIYIQTFSNLRDYNFNITTGSGSAKVGDVVSTNTLNINNGSSHTIRGEVTSGKIEIVN